MKALHRIFRVLTCFPVVLSLLLTGVLLIAGSLLIGNRLWLNLLPIALLILDGIFCILYSYRVWKKYSS